MRLGLGSYACTWALGVPGYPSRKRMDLLGFLKLAAELELDLVQIADNVPLERLSAGELEQLRRNSVNLGIDLEIGTRGIGKDHLACFLELALFLNSQLVRVVVDKADSKPAPEQVVAALRGILPRYEDSSVVLAIENHDRFSVHTLADIVEEVGSPNLGICLDTVNSFGALEGPGVVIDVLGPLTVNLHLKDFSISRLDHMMGFVVEGKAAGEGRLNIPWMLNRLAAQERDPNAILELWPPLQSSVEETIELERRWLFRSISYLKQVLRSCQE